jgi:hypothetical protein
MAMVTWSSELRSGNLKHICLALVFPCMSDVTLVNKVNSDIRI